MSSVEYQRASAAQEHATSSHAEGPGPGKHTLVEAVQRIAIGGGPADPAAVQDTASRGVASASSPLPHGEAIQRAFGRHDISGVRTQTGGAAGEASGELGAQAYATGDRIAFSSAPDLFTAAHEAAHVVQQRNGVHFRRDDGGQGLEPGWLEGHADQVAHRVVGGQSAVDLLDQVAPSTATNGAAAGVQRIPVLRDKQGAWRFPVKKETLGAKITDFDKLPSNKMSHVETDDLAPKDRERLIELIARAGQGGVARELRAKIGDSIYVEGSEVADNHDSIDTLLVPLSTGVPLSAVPALIEQLREQKGRLDDQSQRLIVGARDHGGQAGLNKVLKGDQVDIDEAIKQLSQALVELHDKPKDTLVKYERQTVKFRESLKAARKVSETTAYADLTKGTQWSKEGLDAKVPREESALPKDDEQERAQQIHALSKKNIERLKSSVNLDGPAQTLLDRLIGLPWVIKHATGAFNAISNSGLLSSLTELRATDAGQKASGMSSNKNVEAKGDGGFAFFRMDANNDPMETRYGPTTIIANKSTLEDSNGWVSLHDQLVPLDRPAMQKLERDDTTWRTSKHGEGNLGAGKQTQWTNSYPQNEDQPDVKVSFLDEVFCGPDILPGIAYSVLLELQRIGGTFRERALTLTEDKDLRALVSSLFRVEAKIPWSWQLDEHKYEQVVNPDGDGRYLRSGIIHPEGMAAGAAYDGCKRHQTMIDSVRATLDRPELTTERRRDEFHKLAGFIKEMQKQRTKAFELAKVFLTAAELEKSTDGTDENNARVEVAVKVVNERKQQLETTEEELAHAQEEEKKLDIELEAERKKLVS